MGVSLADRLPDAQRILCVHKAKLEDGKTMIQPTQRIVVPVQLYDDDGVLCPPVKTSFYLIDKLGMEAIVGLPDILAGYFNFFMKVMTDARAELRALDVVPWPEPEFVNGEIVYLWSLPWMRLPLKRTSARSLWLLVLISFTLWRCQWKRLGKNT